MAYFWRCSQCRWLGTFADDEEPQCWNPEHDRDAEHWASAEADLAEEGGEDR
jgi:hypothetical protein